MQDCHACTSCCNCLQKSNIINSVNLADTPVDDTPVTCKLYLFESILGSTDSSVQQAVDQGCAAFVATAEHQELGWLLQGRNNGGVISSRQI